MLEQIFTKMRIAENMMNLVEAIAMLYYIIAVLWSLQKASNCEGEFHLFCYLYKQDVGEIW